MYSYQCPFTLFLAYYFRTNYFLKINGNIALAHGFHVCYIHNSRLLSVGKVCQKYNVRD